MRRLNGDGDVAIDFRRNVENAGEVGGVMKTASVRGSGVAPSPPRHERRRGFSRGSASTVFGDGGTWSNLAANRRVRNLKLHFFELQGVPRRPTGTVMISAMSRTIVMVHGYGNGPS